MMNNFVDFCFSDRLLDNDSDACDKDCISKARVVGLTFSVGRLLHFIAQTMQTAAKLDRSHRQSRFLKATILVTVPAILLLQ